MKPFNWTQKRLNRLRSAVRSYNAAITNRAKELESHGLGYMVGMLPSKVSVSDIKERVKDVNAYRRIVGYRNDAKRGRTSELTRVLKSVNPKALEFTRDRYDNVTTEYSKREYDINQRAIRRQRAKTLKDMQVELFEGDTAQDVGSMTPAEYAAFTSDTDMMPDDAGEFDDSVEDVDSETLTKWRHEDARAKREQVMPDAMYEVYMYVWKDPMNFHAAMGGYQDLISAMEWMVDNRVDVLNKMFNSGRDEIDPNYITESGGNANPYVNIPYETRHNRAVRFIVSTARRAGYEG